MFRLNVYLDLASNAQGAGMNKAGDYGASRNSYKKDNRQFRCDQHTVITIVTSYELRRVDLETIAVSNDLFPRYPTSTDIIALPHHVTLAPNQHA